MRHLSGLLVIFLLVMTAACGSGYNNPPTNVGLFGNWNVAMYPTGSTTPVYVFALAISSEGANNYSGASTTYTGGVAIPANMCINGNSLVRHCHHQQHRYLHHDHHGYFQQHHDQHHRDFAHNHDLDDFRILQ